MIPGAALPAKGGTRTGTSPVPGDRAAVRLDRVDRTAVRVDRVAPGRIRRDPTHRVRRRPAAESGAPALHGPGIANRLLRVRTIAGLLLARMLRVRMIAGLLRVRMLPTRAIAIRVRTIVGPVRRVPMIAGPRRVRMIVGLRRVRMRRTRAIVIRARRRRVSMIAAPVHLGQMHPMRALPAPVRRGSAMGPAALPNSVPRANPEARVRENQLRRNLPAQNRAALSQARPGGHVPSATNDSVGISVRLRTVPPSRTGVEKIRARMWTCMTPRASGCRS